MYRRSDSARATKKRQSPACLPARLMAHVRRWSLGKSPWLVNYQGVRCGDIKTGWKAVREAAGLDEGVTPHTLRHTAITWALQRGVRTWDVAGYFGVSIKVIEVVYGHLSQDHQSSARDAMDRRGT